MNLGISQISYYPAQPLRDRDSMAVTRAVNLPANTSVQAFSLNPFNMVDIKSVQDKLYEMSADKYFNEGKLNEALKIYSNIISSYTPDDPNTINSHHKIALIYQKEGNKTEAESHFKKALSICSKLPRSYKTLGDIAKDLGALYVEQGRYQEANAMYEYTIKVSNYTPTGPIIQNLLSGLQGILTVFKLTKDVFFMRQLNSHSLVQNEPINNNIPITPFDKPIKQLEDQINFIKKSIKDTDHQAL